MVDAGQEPADETRESDHLENRTLFVHTGSPIRRSCFSIVTRRSATCRSASLRCRRIISPSDIGKRFFRRSAHQGGIAERKAMIDPEHDLPITKQEEILRISRGSVYYRPRPMPVGRAPQFPL